MFLGDYRKTLGDLVAYNHYAVFQEYAHKHNMGPYFPEDMNYVKASTRTIKGLIESSCEKSNGQIKLKVSIPVNTTAKVYIPTADPSDVIENFVAADKSPGVHYLRKENNMVIYEVESGQYEFVFENIF